MHPRLVTSRAVPPGLSATATATLWRKHGDHPAVLKVEPFLLEDANQVVEARNGLVELYRGQPPVPVEALRSGRPGKAPVREGERFNQLRPVDAIVRRYEAGLAFDHLVMPGFYVIENDSDGVVWALDPYTFRAWFEPILGWKERIRRFFSR